MKGRQFCSRGQTWACPSPSRVVSYYMCNAPTQTARPRRIASGHIGPVDVHVEISPRHYGQLIGERVKPGFACTHKGVVGDVRVLRREKHRPKRCSGSSSRCSCLRAKKHWAKWHCRSPAKRQQKTLALETTHLLPKPICRL